MANFEEIHCSTSSSIIIGSCSGISAALALLVLENSWAPMMVGVVISAAIAGGYIVRNPLQALYFAIFMALIPSGLRVDPIYTILSNLAYASAFLSWGINWLLRREVIRWNMTWVFLTFYIVLGGISLLWAPDLVEGRREAITYIIGFILLFLIIQQVQTARALDGLMRVMRCIGWIIVGGGLFEVITGAYQPGQRLSVFEINQNQLVMIMLLLMPSFIWPVLHGSGVRRRVRFFSCLTFFLCTCTFIALGGSRGGALSLLTLVAGALLSRRMRPWALVGTALMVGVVAVAPFVLETLTQRFEEQEGGSFGGRDLLWEAGLFLVKDQPWGGVGLGGGALELPKYIALMTGDTFLNSKRVFPSHNPLLEVGSDTGLFGLVLYVAMLISALWQAVRKISLGGNESPMSLYRPLILVVAAAYFVSWIKSGGMENNPTFFILLGLLVISSSIEQCNSEEGAGRVKF